MPEMIVWPVSSSLRAWNVGSSSTSRDSTSPIRSWSSFVFGSIATEITGSGNLIASRIDRLVLVAKSVAREGVLQGDGGGDLAGLDLGHFLAAIRMHAKDAARVARAGRGCCSIPSRPGCATPEYTRK